MSAGLYSFVTRLRTSLRGDALAAATDAELLARYSAERDDIAFAELVYRHAPAVYARCRRHLSDAHFLEDAFQATFVVLSRKAGSLTNPDRVSGWLCGVADVVARKARVRNARRTCAERPLDSVEEPWEETDPPNSDLRAVLDEELNALPPDMRRPLVLCDVDGVSRRTAAARLGIPVGTLSNRLTRARAMLGTRLLRRGVTLGAGLSLSSVAVASVPAKLVSLTVSRIATDAMPAHVLSLASIGVPPMTLFKSATALLAGLLVVGVAFGPTAAGEPPKAELPVPAKKPADLEPPDDPEPEEVKGYHQVSASAYSRDGKRVALVRSDTKEVKVYDTATWKVTHTLEGLKALSFAVQFSPDGGAVYAASMDGPIHTWDTKTGKAGSPLDAKAGKCYGLVLSPDGKTLASAHDDQDAGKTAIHLWDAATGKAGRVIASDEPLLANTITFSPDGKTISGGYHASHKKKPDDDGFHGVIEWDAATGKEQKRFDTPRITPGAHPVAHAIAYTPDGKKLILGGGEAVPIPGAKGSSMLYGYLWVIDRKTGEVENTLVANRSDYIRTLAMSPDGGKLYVPADRLAARAIPRGAPPNPPYEFQCWDTSTWEVSWSVSSLTPRGVTNVAVSPDGKRLGLTGMDGFHLHDAKTGEAKGGLVTYVRPR